MSGSGRCFFFVFSGDAVDGFRNTVPPPPPPGLPWLPTDPALEEEELVDSTTDLDFM